jgi:hypothetical protein
MLCNDQVLMKRYVTLLHIKMRFFWWFTFWGDSMLAWQLVCVTIISIVESSWLARNRLRIDPVFFSFEILFHQVCFSFLSVFVFFIFSALHF